MTLLGLEPLTERQTEEMVTGLLASDLPAPVREALVERAGGNPFFVEELVATLIDHGLLAALERRLEGRGASGGVRDSGLRPGRARGADRPPTAGREGRAAGGVRHRSCSAGAARAVARRRAAELRAARGADFIRRRSGSSFPGEREFVIKHALTREVAYASLPKARRAKLHASLAQWMERSREARDEYAGILGHHYAEAVRPEDADLAWAGADDELEELRRKALYWLERAADLAVRRYEIDDGVTLYHRALELTDDRRVQTRIWHALGRAYAFKFDGLRFWDAMQKAIDLCDDATLRGDLYADLALHTAGRIGMWPVLPESETLLGWIDRALELAPADSASRAKAFAARSMWGRAHGELSGGRTPSKQAPWPSASGIPTSASSRGPAAFSPLTSTAISRRRSPWRRARMS